jgi:hypothetical protein
MNSHELPVPPETALKRVIAASERAKTTARPFPRPSVKARLFTACFSAVVISLCVWLFLRHRSVSVVFIPLFVCALVMAIWDALRRRCPQCKYRLVFRREDVYGTSLYRDLYDCPHCRTVWDTGFVGDHEKDNTG